jgi:PTH2 family peptidyl-tRNA hydrolase
MKQVIVIRKDLNMRKGKMVAQGAHASMAAILPNMSCEQVKEWLAGAFTKICVGVNSEEELVDIYANACAYGMICSIIKDNGATEFNGVPTYTAVAVGPDYEKAMDMVTGHLKLL